MLTLYGISDSSHVLSCPTRAGIQDSWIPVFTGMTQGANARYPRFLSRIVIENKRDIVAVAFLVKRCEGVEGARVNASPFSLLG